MRRTLYRGLIVTLVFALTNGAFGVEPPLGDDATITVGADGEMHDDVDSLIELPAPAAPPAAATGGLSTADQAHQEAAVTTGPDFGQSVANEARARNDMRAAIREEAKQQTRDDNKPGKGRGPPGN